MRKIFLGIVASCMLTSCAELQSIAQQMPSSNTSTPLSSQQIGNGLKEALRLGITEQVSKLAKENGFYGNALVRIGLPSELQNVADGLRKIGLESVADKGIKALNSAAEDAVQTAIPIFIDAVKGMSFQDAKSILLGNNNSATTYLKGQTSKALYAKFNPIIKKSFEKVGADKIWQNVIRRYNTIPFTSDVNPDLTDYVTQQALKGVFTMIAVKEKDLRANISSRTSTLLQQVFAMQD